MLRPWPMRWYQETAIPMFRAAIKAKHTKLIGQAPTGWGKTVLAAHIFDSAMLKTSRCLFACPRISLVDQTLEAFEKQGIRDIGIMQASHKRTDAAAQLQIACFDTLYKRDFIDFDLVVVDEIHMADARMWDLLKKWKIVLGLTATPWTKGLGLHFTKLLVFSTLHEMIVYHDKDPGVGLVPVRGKGPDLALLRGVSKLSKGADGEFKEKGAAALMGRKEVIADVVETWLKTRQDGSHPGDRTFLFCPTRANAQSLQEAFLAQGVRFDYIDAFTSERSPIFRRFRSREIAGIASVGCLTTGVDEDVRCISDAALSNSESTIVQKIGRGMRPAEGKEYLWLNDHTGNANRFGWFADIFHDVLDTTPPHIPGSSYPEEEKIAVKERKQRQCGMCRMMLARSAIRCPSCGTKVLFDDVEVIAGELVDLSAPRKSTRKERAEARKAKEIAKAKQTYYSGMLWQAKQKGLKPGWAAFRFREQYGDWPNGLKVQARKPPPEIIAEEVKRYREYKASQAAKPQLAPHPFEEYHGDF